MGILEEELRRRRTQPPVQYGASGDWEQPSPIANAIKIPSLFQMTPAAAPMSVLMSGAGAPMTRTSAQREANVADITRARGVGQTAGSIVGGMARTGGAIASDLAEPIGRGAQVVGGGLSDFARTAWSGVPTQAAPVAAQGIPGTTPIQGISGSYSVPSDAVAAYRAAQVAGSQQPAIVQPAQVNNLGFTVNPTKQAGINRITGKGLNSPLFTNIAGVGEATKGMTGGSGEPMGGTLNTLPASYFASASPEATRGLQEARKAAGARGDFDAVRASYQGGGGTFGGETSIDSAMKEAIWTAQNGSSPRSRSAAVATIRELGNIQNDRARSEQAGQEFGLKQEELGMKKQQFTATVAQQKKLNDLHDKFVGSTTPEEQKRLGDQILTLMGKDPSDGKVQVILNDELINPEQPTLGMMKVAYVYDARTGAMHRVKDMAGGGGKQYVEGQTYKDAKGNVAVWTNGQMVPLKK